jgi:hypothetical protein
LKTGAEEKEYEISYAGSSLSDVQKGAGQALPLQYLYTNPLGADSHDCLTLHFAKNVNERRAKSLNPTLPTAVFRLKDIAHIIHEFQPTRTRIRRAIVFERILLPMFLQYAYIN